MICYFYIVPMLFGSKNPKDDDPNVPPPEPVPIWWTIAKTVLWIAALACMFLAMIYFRQESMLFCPSAPIQFINQNPAQYASPSVRGLEWEEVQVMTDDNLKL